MPYSVASGSGVNGHCEQERCSEDSIVRALDKFVTSYDRMQQTIMIPSRLKDMPVTVHFHKGTEHLPGNLIKGAGQLVISNGKSETKTIDMYNVYEVLQCVRQELSLGMEEPGVVKPKARRVRHQDSDGSGRSTPSTDSGVQEVTSALEGASLEDEEKNKQMQLAALFRQHLQGLYTVLHQMTDAAELLSKTYTDSLN